MMQGLKHAAHVYPMIKNVQGELSRSQGPKLRVSRRLGWMISTSGRQGGYGGGVFLLRTWAHLNSSGCAGPGVHKEAACGVWCVLVSMA